MRQTTPRQRLMHWLQAVFHVLFPAWHARVPLRLPVRTVMAPVGKSPRASVHKKISMLVIFSVAFLAATASASTIYVDSRIGDDRFDGLSMTQSGEFSGPVRTIRRAVTLIEPGDTIELINNGTPYEGAVLLQGPKMSGVPGFPLQIIGNGAVISGAQPIPPRAWKYISENLWRITPRRKGWYQLILEDKALPEVKVPPEATELPAMEPGSWCAWRGRIYYRSEPFLPPRELELLLATEQTGFSLWNIENVLIRDLTIRHFQQDGINLHDCCRNIRLENVTLVENGRTGLTVGGTSAVDIEKLMIQRNREHSLLIEELGRVDDHGSEFDVEPTVRIMKN